MICVKKTFLPLLMVLFLLTLKAYSAPVQWQDILIAPETPPSLCGGIISPQIANQPTTSSLKSLFTKSTFDELVVVLNQMPVNLKSKFVQLLISLSSKAEYRSNMAQRSVSFSLTLWETLKEFANSRRSADVSIDLKPNTFFDLWQAFDHLRFKTTKGNNHFIETHTSSDPKSELHAYASSEEPVLGLEMAFLLQELVDVRLNETSDFKQMEALHSVVEYMETEGIHVSTTRSEMFDEVERLAYFYYLNSNPWFMEFHDRYADAEPEQYNRGYDLIITYVRSLISQGRNAWEQMHAIVKHVKHEIGSPLQEQPIKADETQTGLSQKNLFQHDFESGEFNYELLESSTIYEVPDYHTQNLTHKFQFAPGFAKIFFGNPDVPIAEKQQLLKAMKHGFEKKHALHGQKKTQQKHGLVFEFRFNKRTEYRLFGCHTKNDIYVITMRHKGHKDIEKILAKEICK